VRATTSFLNPQGQFNFAGWAFRLFFLGFAAWLAHFCGYAFHDPGVRVHVIGLLLLVFLLLLTRKAVLLAYVAVALMMFFGFVGGYQVMANRKVCADAVADGLQKGTFRDTATMMNALRLKRDEDMLSLVDDKQLVCRWPIFMGIYMVYDSRLETRLKVRLGSGGMEVDEKNKDDEKDKSP